MFSGADPRSVVCAFFKQGQCSKGDKCKFSHDLALDRKGEKRSLYVDQRDAEEEELKNGKLKNIWIAYVSPLKLKCYNYASIIT